MSELFEHVVPNVVAAAPAQRSESPVGEMEPIAATP